MVDFTPDGATVFRDFVTDGVPLSGPNDPVKADLRAWAEQIEDAITTVTDAVDLIEEDVGAFVGGTGKTVVDFGAFPGNSDTSITVTGQTGLTSASGVRAWVEATDTTDHTADEHWVDPPMITVGNIGTGSFTIYATARESFEGDTPYGQWTIAWVWTN